MFDLKGKTILVAGGAGYLGLPLCQEIARHGGNLCIADFHEQRLQQAVAAIKAEHADTDVLGLYLDVGDEASIKTCLGACTEHFGSLYGLVNGTFGGTGKVLEDLTGEDFDRANHLNLTGSFLLARGAASLMGEGGSIVMYASMYGVVAPNRANYPGDMPPNPIEYGAGKAGMVQMVRYLAAHYGPKNIRVNGVAPGPFPNVERKGLVEGNGLPDEFIQRLNQATMLGRTGRAHETAGPVVFLLSNAASYVTGHLLNVDGGWTAW